MAKKTYNFGYYFANFNFRLDEVNSRMVGWFLSVHSFVCTILIALKNYTYRKDEMNDEIEASFWYYY